MVIQLKDTTYHYQFSGIELIHDQLSQRHRAAGYVSFGQKWETRTGRK